MTEVYGASDDLIEFDGDFRGEVGNYGTDEDGSLVIMSDNPLFTIRYNEEGIWKIDVLHKGALFDRIEICTDPEEERYSDTLFFKEGIKWAYMATGDWEAVK